ncbi:hypothetical protein C4D60_Mb07t08680 [Musa balbisiana]|uniref:GDT1 family protein n=1 Tax=Musa balbisiana TaxID=52838 RepID=A0A4S8JDW8_MUSBA|nr:hypothetical protein C4D60_Mb07t08680 [Musa balbisiana]
MGLSLIEGFTKSLAMTVLSEIGDKTFFAAAILAMRHPRKLVLSGCLTALIVMTILSASLGWAAPNLISRRWSHHLTTVLFFGFGLWSLWEGFTEEGEAEELKEVEAKLNADWKAETGSNKGDSKVRDDLKKQQRPFLTQFFSPVFLKAFSITFFGEWGDKSQIATIGLASDENPFGVVLGGIVYGIHSSILIICGFISYIQPNGSVWICFVYFDAADKHSAPQQQYLEERAWRPRYQKKWLHSPVAYFS